MSRAELGSGMEDAGGLISPAKVKSIKEEVKLVALLLVPRVSSRMVVIRRPPICVEAAMPKSP